MVGNSKLERQPSVDLSIVLVTWNALEFTAAALESIERETTGISYEIFVVDNGTTKDDTANALPRRFPKVRFIANKANLGFSRANNQAVRRAQGRYVVLLNNDTVQIENALGKTVRYMDERPEVGAVGITHLNNDEARSYQPSFFEFPKPWDEVSSLLGGGIETAAPPDYAREQDVDWIVGSYLFMRRECYEDVGELDERFFVYDEDVDWCLRARRAGWVVRYWPGAKMIHVGSAARPFMKDKTFVHFRSHLSYIKKNHSLSAAGAYYAAMGVRLSMATCKHGALALVGRSTLKEFKQRVDRERQFLLLRSGRSGV